MSEQDKGGFPRNQTRGQDAESTTGDGHPPRPSEQGSQEGVAGQGLGQTGSGSSGSRGRGSTGSGLESTGSGDISDDM